MTTAVNDTVERSEINGTGPYSFNFRIFADSDLTLVALSTDTPPAVVPMTLGSHYSVSGVNNASGGTVTLDSSFASTYAGYDLDIRSNIPVEQPTSLRNSGRFPPESVEDALDRLNRQQQDLRRIVSLCVRFPDNMTARGEMTPIQSWLSKYLAIGPTGTLEAAELTSSGALTQSIIGGLLYPQTDFEDSRSVTALNKAYPEFHIHRYALSSEAIGDGVTDAEDAWNECKKLGKIILGGPQYTYYTPDGFFITEDDVHVVGNWSTLKQSTTNAVGFQAPLTVSGVSGVLVENLVIDTNNIASSNILANGIASEDADNLTLRHIRFINGGQIQVYATGLVTTHHYQFLRADTIGYGVLVYEPDAGSSGLYIDNCTWDLQGTDQSDGVAINAPTNGFTLVRVSNCVVRRAHGNALNAGLGYSFSTVTDLQISNCFAEDCSNDGFHFEDNCQDVRATNIHAVGCTHVSTNTTGALAIAQNCKRIEIIGFTSKNSATKTQLSAAIALISPSGQFNDDVTILGGCVQDGRVNNVQIESCRRLKIIGLDSINPNTSNTAGAGHFSVRKFTANVNSGVLIQGCSTTDGANAAQSVTHPDGTSVVGERLIDCDFSQAGTKLFDTGTGEIIDASGITYSRSVARTGTIAPAVGTTTTVVTNANADRISGIRIFALNAAAQTLGNAWVSAITRGTSFTITHAAAAGTESYGYEIT